MFQTNIRQVLGYLFPQIISFHWNIIKKQIDYWVIRFQGIYKGN